MPQNTTDVEHHVLLDLRWYLVIQVLNRVPDVARLANLAGDNIGARNSHRVCARINLARKMAGLLLTRGGLDITDLANIHKKDNAETAKMYAELSDRLGIIWMNRCVEDLEVEGRWQAIARSNLRDDFYRIRRDIATDLLSGRSRGTPLEVFERWMEKNSAAVRKFDAILTEMRLRDDIDFATLSVAAQELRKLSDAN